MCFSHRPVTVYIPPQGFAEEGRASLVCPHVGCQVAQRHNSDHEEFKPFWFNNIYCINLKAKFFFFLNVFPLKDCSQSFLCMPRSIKDPFSS